MTPAAGSTDPVEAAWALLDMGRSPSEVLAVVATVDPGHPQFASAQHLRGVCALRQGDAEGAKPLLIDAIRREERRGGSIWLNLAVASATTGMPDDEALTILRELLRRAPPDQLVPFSQRLLHALGFMTKEPVPGKAAAFEKLVLPLLALLLERRQMDEALNLENLLYENFVKAIETEAHFIWCMDRIAPVFTEAGRRWRHELPPQLPPPLAPPCRIGFFIHSASMLAHVEVLLNILKGYRSLDTQPFEPIVYAFGGKSPELERALAGLDVRLVMLNERFPETQASPWRRLLRLREALPQDGVQELVWVSLLTILPLAFSLRIAPVQTWLAMKYRNFSHADIDGYVTGSALTRFGMLCGRRWRMGLLGVDDWYDVSLEARAAEIRASLGDGPVLATLARTEKMQDPAYLQAVVAILKANPAAAFLWTGREESPAVVRAFEAAGIGPQTRFIGWVNTRLYAQVADIFLDSFPFPCGFTLFQAMAAGKPVVVYESPEAVQTGLWGFLKPLLEDGEGTEDERSTLRGFVGDEDRPLIAVARTPDDYVRNVNRLLQDGAARAAAGEASQRFITHYFSDPKALGASMAQHFMELIEDAKPA